MEKCLNQDFPDFPDNYTPHGHNLNFFDETGGQEKDESPPYKSLICARVQYNLIAFTFFHANVGEIFSKPS
jgi:hypothetical protein